MVKTHLLHRVYSLLHRGPVSVESLSLRVEDSRAQVQREKVRRVLRQGAGLLIAAFCFIGQRAYAVDYTVHIKTTSPALASELLGEATTGYFLGKATKSTVFTNTWNVVLTGKNPNAPGGCPPDNLTKQDLLDALTSISSSTYPYGWAAGMDYERGDNIQTLQGMQGADFAQKTIGGKPYVGGYTIPEIMGTTTPVAGFTAKYVSTSTVHIECLGIYNAAVQTIKIKDFAEPQIILGP